MTEIKSWLKPYSASTQLATFTTLAQAVPVLSNLPCDMIIVSDRFPEARGAILLKGLRKLCPSAQFIILASDSTADANLTTIARSDLNVSYFPQPWDNQGLLAHIEAAVGKEAPSFAMAMAFGDDQMEKISSILDKLIEETAALSIYLVTSLGQVLDYKGSELKQIGEISSLLGGSFAALQQLGPTLEEQGPSANLIHRQGQSEDLYALSVGNEALLVLRFGVSPTTPRIGTVALYARRAVEELTEVLASGHTRSTSPFGNASVTDTLNTELNQLFSETDTETDSSVKSKLLTFTDALKKGLVSRSLVNRWDSARTNDQNDSGEGEEE